MSKQFFTILSIVFILIAITGTVSATPDLDEVHYVLSGDGNRINSINFNMNYDFDAINSLDAFFTYYDGDIKIEGSWLINFMRSQDNSFNLELAILSELSNISFTPAIGISGTSSYEAENKLYWDVDYFLNQEKSFVYKGGIVLPLNSSGDITVGFGNSYWYINEPQINIGLLVDF